MNHSRVATSLTLIALALAVFPSAQAQEQPTGTIGPNIGVTITVGEIEDDGSKPNRSYKMMTRSGSNAELLIGWRTPIPTATSDPDGDDGADVTSFVYQNIGMTANIEVRPRTLNLESNGKWVTGRIELPDPYDVADIKIPSVKLQDLLVPIPGKWSIEDSDSNGLDELVLKFDRSDFQMTCRSMKKRHRRSPGRSCRSFLLGRKPTPRRRLRRRSRSSSHW